MMQDYQFIGVDAAKDELVIAVQGQRGSQVVANTVGALSDWLAGLGRQAVIAVESTGRCHQLLVAQALRQGLTVFVLNARDVYFYIKALGLRGKTDRTDAQAIARYLAEHHAHLRPYRPPTAQQAELDRLLDQRWTATTKWVALRQSLADAPAMAAARAQLAQAFETLFEAIDARIQTLIDGDTPLRQAQLRLQSIVGIGQQSSAMLANLLCRIPFEHADALVAYSGLDPRPHDSGRSRGRRRLSKRGVPALRRQMYLAAMAACRSKVLRPLYQQLKARGFKTTEALVILARKLLRYAYAVFKSGQPFDPTRLATGA